ncbi:MAG: hypothetical protein SGILL_005783 [Bacillariaceae sp.]
MESTAADDDDAPFKTKTPQGETVSKFRQLKDLMWVRECLEDLTAAEFALSVEQSQSEQQSIKVVVNGQASDDGDDDEANGTTVSAPPTKKKKRAVDYEKLLTQLTKRIEDMTCEPFVEQVEEVVVEEEEEDDDDADKTVAFSVKKEHTVPVLNEHTGMGRYAYTNEERLELLEAIHTRHNIDEVLQGHMLEDGELEEGFLKMPEIPELRIATGDSGDGNATFGPQLYVRDDGTVDWEGALQDRAALRKFGGSVWARINGQTPDDLEDDEDGDSKAAAAFSHDEKKPVTAKIEETEAIKRAREQLKSMKAQLKESEKAHTALVASGIKAGQPVANVRLASVDPILRNKIRQSAEHLLVLEQQVSYQGLVYDLERIYTYLASELGNPSSKGYIPLQDRLNVAEYGLLEGQIESCSKELNMKGVLDADILAVIAEQMTDFKRRLGIDYYVTGLTWDREAIMQWLNDLFVKSKDGVMFYVKGTRLFWNDVVYCSSLIGRAAQGYTLKPREVRTIRRTFKDVITFIPVVIILIIPLSPVGHVLVFGAIQRFFPGFFPSCFTEQRQNLLQLYETTEFSEVTIKENLQERTARFLEAFVFVIASKSRNLYKALFNPGEPSDEQTDGKSS